MESMIYRPWGILDWVLPRYPTATWSFCGSVGTEERSIASIDWLRGRASLGLVRMLRVLDPPSAQYGAAAALALGRRQNDYIAAGGAAEDVEDHSLIESHDAIVQTVNRFLDRCTPNVILDVTSLPKRFFFPILKLLMTAGNRLQNLLVTYTVPATYTRDKLAGNFNDWEHVPLFAGDYSRPPPDYLVAAVGFEALGLQDQLDQLNASVRIRLLLPFPAPPSSFQRSWTVVQRLRERLQPESVELYRCDAKDVSDTFDRLRSLSNSGQKRVLLAPFGPKPMSVAMCVFATLTDSEVFYTQPMVYHPEYSSGVSEVRGQKEIYGYCLKIEGKSFYAV